MNKFNKAEKALLEGIETMLQHDAQLGLKMHSDQLSELGSTERGFEYLHNQIDDMFMLKAAELQHANGVCQSFKKVHNYKYLDDPSFTIAMQKEMVAQAVPAEERNAAINFIPEIIKELKEDQAEWAEKDYGFNPNLSEILQTGDIEQPLELNIEDREDWAMESNVDYDLGDASPGHVE